MHTTKEVKQELFILHSLHTPAYFLWGLRLRAVCAAESESASLGGGSDKECVGKGSAKPRMDLRHRLKCAWPAHPESSTRRLGMCTRTRALTHTHTSSQSHSTENPKKGNQICLFSLLQLELHDLPSQTRLNAKAAEFEVCYEMSTYLLLKLLTVKWGIQSVWKWGGKKNKGF